MTDLLLNEPHIELTALEAIKAPTLVLAGDHDIIRDEHTVAIFQHIPNSQLAIFPSATHMVPFDEPELFNSTVERFLRTPFVRRDRISDLLPSLEKMRAAQR
ncbi:MAG TPA: alpha/beta hydrolase [Pyrinomonadaceae bacterium]|nr:alpha/beta hydrolase [Pyrinomonadaceae bacterium]